MQRGVTAVSWLTIALAIGSASAQDHLTSEGDPFGQDKYHAKICEVFADVLRSDIVVQILFVPSFEPEEIVGIRRSKRGFEAFAAKPSTQIWTTFNIQEIESGRERWSDANGPIPPAKNPSLLEMKKSAPSDYRQIHVDVAARPIPDVVTERIRTIWEEMIGNARDETDGILGTDGEDYHFSMPSRDRGRVSATIWSPRAGKTRALVSLGEVLADYARGRADEAALIRTLKPLERKKP